MMSTVGAREDPRQHHEELVARRNEAKGEAFERINEEMMDVRRRLYDLDEDRGLQLIAPEFHRVIARVRAELDGYLGNLD